MHGHATSGYLIAAAILVACSTEETTEDAGSRVFDAAASPDARAPLADAAEGDADAAPLPDAAPAPAPDAAIEECGRIRCDCTFNGIALFGRVQYVTNFADITVRETPFPDLRVREGAFADSCGEWDIVDSFPDFTVEIVTSFEDFGIEYSAFPGIP